MCCVCVCVFDDELQNTLVDSNANKSVSVCINNFFFEFACMRASVCAFACVCVSVCVSVRDRVRE